MHIQLHSEYLLIKLIEKDAHHPTKELIHQRVEILHMFLQAYTQSHFRFDTQFHLIDSKRLLE